MGYGIKFRPDKPKSPHLNGKVERSQKTDKADFYATVDITATNSDAKLCQRQHFYNWERLHNTHNGKSPMERYFELMDETPFSEEVSHDYHPEDEHIQEAN